MTQKVVADCLAYERKVSPIRTRRLKKNRIQSVRNENVDRQIRVLHLAMGRKLVDTPALVSQVFKKLEERYQAGRIKHWAYISWFSLLESIEDSNLFMTTLGEDNAYMRRLRRNSPMVGILTEEERTQILEQQACGELSEILL